MPEFVNPKYTDGTKTAFKSPTRLECMMQDYPKSLEPSAPVGFTIVTKTTTFSPVKTNLADAVKKSDEGMPTYSAASGEADAYKCGREMLAACGVPLQPGSESSMAGVRVELGARVVIDPSFGIGLSAWKARLPLAEQIKITSRSTLLLQGDVSGVSIEQLDLDGTLVLRACEGAKVTLKRCNVSNAGWSFKSLWGGVGSDEALAIRGYSLSQNAQRELVFDKPGEYIVEDEEASARLSIWWGLPAVIALLVALLCAAFWPLPR
jgi:UDP-sugar pyrophosphorylase